jgi:glycosyltransferase involved in cell wall biosynthesis
MDDWVEGLPVLRLPLPRHEGVGVLPFYAQLLRLLISQRHSYDLIHAHAVHHHAYAGFLAGRLLDKPAIAKIALVGHDDPASIARRRLGGVQLQMLRQASMLVATSQEMIEAVTAFGWPSHRLTRIPNGVDTDHFRPLRGAARADLRVRLGLPEDSFVVIFVGIVARRKGLHALARAWTRVKQSHPGAILLLVGPCLKREHWGVDERYVTEVKATLAKTGVTDSVRFVGQAADPGAYLQASDLFALPSRSEGMPNALLEAMACGLPFVATRLGCIEEMSPPEQHPYLVPVDDADVLAEAIIALAHDDDRLQGLGTAARRVVETRYSLDAISDRYVELYRELLERK